MEKITFGTLINGTQRSEDLIPALSAELKRLGPAPHQRFVRKYPEIESGAIYCVANEELCGFCIAELFDELNRFAPEGCYFGAHPCDGSDYGFWAGEPG